jgi:acyl-CoA reductase-like NAD-dependent aldehyde dehydrogenase
LIPGTEGREAHVHRVPLGPVVGITPFNFRSTSSRTKLPALAAGDSIIIRPPVKRR